MTLHVRSLFPATVGVYDTGMSALKTVPLSKLRENPLNPRQDYGDLSEMAAGMKTTGIIEPIIVRPLKKGEYEIVAGHRRSRAAKLAGLREVDVVVRDYNAQEALETAIVENTDRESLNPLEIALGYQRLTTEFGMDSHAVAARAGKPRSTILGYMSILKAIEPVQQAVRKGLSLDAARALAGVHGERLQATVLSEAMKLVKAGEKWPSSRAVIRLAQRYKQTAKRGLTKRQKEERAHGTEVALRRRVLERLLLRVGELVERRPHLSDDDMRIAAALRAEAGGETERAVFERHGLRPDRLSKVSGSQLRKLLQELNVAPAATLEGGEFSAGAKALAKAYNINLGELTKNIENETKAEALFLGAERG